MIDRKRLLADLKPLLKQLEADLRARCDELTEIAARLQREYKEARDANRTGAAIEEWRADLITQVAVAWVLSCVFVRFLEDNALIAPPRISGPLHGAGDDAGLQRARDEREHYFKSHAKETDRDYLLSVFDELAKLPGTKDVFGSHNVALAYRDWLSGDAAQKLIEFFQRVDTDGSGEIVHNFTDANWDTRFLGDLYQDLSEAARKKYALLQTPIFVEEFILDRTLEPAIDEFGLKDFKMIDPACGSGHFVLGAFARILVRWRGEEPGTPDRELVNRSLASVHGVDVNPYAVAIARFRLLLVAMRECRITKLKDAPAFAFNLVCGDSLLHGAPGNEQQMLGFHELAHVYESEDLPELRRILTPGGYHAVVANPPYITVKDRALNEAYRERYASCHRKYSLAVPFFERLFGLARSASGAGAGFVGQITSNSFMKREFGKKLIETYLPRWDLTHVIDTSGAYIPGHGTPTVILFGRNRAPVSQTIRAVLGIRGEPSTPDDPATARVWSAIMGQIDVPGSESEFVSVSDAPRANFHAHPWSIGGGGAAELKETLDQGAENGEGCVLDKIADSIGITSFTLEDDIYLLPRHSAVRRGLDRAAIRSMVVGDSVRDWDWHEAEVAVFPYDADFKPIKCDATHPTLRYLWQGRICLANNILFGQQTKVAAGLNWYEYGRLTSHKLRTPLSIVFAEISTHNHFVIDRGGKVFNRSAPVIKLVGGTSEDDHLSTLAILNSSVGLFWLKQGAHNKGDSTDDHGARTTGDVAFNTYAFNGTLVGKLPLCSDRFVALSLARDINALAESRAQRLPTAIVTGQRAGPEAAETSDLRPCAAAPQGRNSAPGGPSDAAHGRSGAPHGPSSAPDGPNSAPEGRGAAIHGSISAPDGARSAIPAGDAPVPTRADLDAARAEAEHILQQMIARQEELDWLVYRAYGLLDDAAAEYPDAGGTPGAADNGGHAGQTPTPPSPPLPPIRLGERAFEIVMARRMERGELQTEWFRRHGSTPITQIPSHWPAEYRQVIERRIALIEAGPGQRKDIALIEQPEYKRRWNVDSWDALEEKALRGWLLDRLESYFDLDGRMNTGGHPTADASLRHPRLTSVAQLADIARRDRDLLQVAELFVGRIDFDIAKLVGDLVTAESVPGLPVLRYKSAALDKRAAWERTWELQRLEDAVDALFEVELLKKIATRKAEETLRPQVTALRIEESAKPHVLRETVTAADYVAAALKQNLNLESDDIIKPVRDAAKRAKKAAVGDIPVPPKYSSADFLSSNYWRLRGKLDVPKERWVSFPHCEGEDGSLVIAWAGYDHLQLARAIAERYELAKEHEGRKLVPLLAAIGQLIPWLKQWHNDLDPVFNQRMGDYFEGYLAEESKALGMSVAEVMAWKPPEKVNGRGRKAKA